MRFTTQWRAAFRVKSFKAVVIRKEVKGGGGGGGKYGSLVEEPRRGDVDILGWGWEEVVFGQSCDLMWSRETVSRKTFSETCLAYWKCTLFLEEVLQSVFDQSLVHFA